MKQVPLNLNLYIKNTRVEMYLEQMAQDVPRGGLVALIAPYYPQGRTGGPHIC